MKSYQELQCSPCLVGEHQKLSNCFAAVDIILSITTFLGNSLIPVALNLPSTRRPNPSLSDNNWPVDWSCCSASPCYLLDVGGSQTLESLSLRMGCSLHYRSTCGVSLLTMAVISLDRLIALLSGLRYKEIVTLKRIYITIASFWVLCLVASLSTIFDRRTTVLYALILIPLSLLISLASCTKILRILRHLRHKYKVIFNNSWANQMY